MKLTKPVISTKECCQEHAGEIFNIKLAIRFKETWEQIKFLNSRYGDFQVKIPIQSRYVTKRQNYEHMTNLIKGDTDIIFQMVNSDRVFE